MWKVILPSSLTERRYTWASITTAMRDITYLVSYYCFIMHFYQSTINQEATSNEVQTAGTNEQVFFQYCPRRGYTCRGEPSTSRSYCSAANLIFRRWSVLLHNKINRTYNELGGTHYEVNEVKGQKTVSISHNL